MRDQLDRILSRLPGQIGLYMKKLSGESYAYHADEPFEAASVIKLPIMAEAFRQFEAGEIERDRLITIRPEDKLPSCGALSYMHNGLAVTVLDLVTLMIILSDNTATNLLIDLLGMEKINAMIDAMELTGTRLNRKLFRPELSARGIQNYVTARDMGRMMELLLRGELVSRDASREMLTILRNQRLNGKMPFYLHSRDIPVAHKTGEDDGITHDVGIIFAQEPITLCFLSNRTVVPVAERALQEIAAIAVDG